MRRALVTVPGGVELSGKLGNVVMRKIVQFCMRNDFKKLWSTFL